MQALTYVENLLNQGHLSRALRVLTRCPNSLTSDVALKLLLIYRHDQSKSPNIPHQIVSFLTKSEITAESQPNEFLALCCLKLDLLASQGQPRELVKQAYAAIDDLYNSGHTEPARELAKYFEQLQILSAQQNLLQGQQLQSENNFTISNRFFEEAAQQISVLRRVDILSPNPRRQGLLLNIAIELAYNFLAIDEANPERNSTFIKASAIAQQAAGLDPNSDSAQLALILETTLQTINFSQLTPKQLAKLVASLQKLESTTANLPHSAVAVLNLCINYLLLHDKDNAAFLGIKVYKSALAQNRFDPSWGQRGHLCLAFIQFRLGWFDQALDTLSATPELTNNLATASAVAMHKNLFTALIYHTKIAVDWHRKQIFHPDSLAAEHNQNVLRHHAGILDVSAATLTPKNIRDLSALAELHYQTALDLAVKLQDVGRQQEIARQKQLLENSWLPDLDTYQVM